MAAGSADQHLAQHLAAPFMLPGQNAKPLSFRLLPEGGMVVISADGRKLWFTAEEMESARQELGYRKPGSTPGKTRSKPAAIKITATPCGGSRDGRSEMIVLPPDLQHLEKLVNDKTRRH